MEWSEEKNKILKQDRNITFEELTKFGFILKVEKNKSSNHKNQKEMHIFYKNYVYKVPFVIKEDGKTWFLKTAFKNRKLTKFYKDKYEGFKKSDN